MGLKLNSTIEAMQEKRRLEKNIRELKRSIEDDALKRQVLAAFEQETETLQNSSPASATAVAHDAVQSIEAVQDLMAGADRTPRRALRRPHAVKQAPVPEDETEVGSIKRYVDCPTLHGTLSSARIIFIRSKLLRLFYHAAQLTHSVAGYLLSTERSTTKERC